MSAVGVLLVEDDDAISAPLMRGLEREGYRMSLATDGHAGLTAGLDPKISVVLLDIGLPGLDGLAVCRRLRESRPTLQILMLTARAEEVHAVDGLDAGADDYIAKPFRLAELLARVRAAARRATPSTVQAAGVRVDLAARQAFLGDSELSLSPKEFDVLAMLVQQAGKLVSRQQLLREVWQLPWHGSSRTLDQHISWLRAKVGAQRITTIRGKGFRFSDEPP